jgi:hypothetical protein
MTKKDVPRCCRNESESERSSSTTFESPGKIGMAAGVQEVYTISEPTGNKRYLSDKIIPLHSSLSAYRTKIGLNKN